MAQETKYQAEQQLEKLRSKETYHEQALKDVREAMREIINRHNLNKPA